MPLDGETPIERARLVSLADPQPGHRNQASIEKNEGHSRALPWRHRPILIQPFEALSSCAPDRPTPLTAPTKANFKNELAGLRDRDAPTSSRAGNETAVGKLEWL